MKIEFNKIIEVTFKNLKWKQDNYNHIMRDEEVPDVYFTQISKEVCYLSAVVGSMPTFLEEMYLDYLKASAPKCKELHIKFLINEYKDYSDD